MAEPTSGPDARRQGMRKSRRVAVGVSVGAAALLTGTIAVANAAPHDKATTTDRVTNDDSVSSYDDDYEDAVPFSPQSQSQSSSGTASQLPTQPQTRSGGS